MNKIIYKLIDEMLAQNISQRELAKKSKICFSSINRYLNGERIPNIERICKIADALGFEVVLKRKDQNK